MIESVLIANAATFGDQPEHFDGLSQFNYVFGSNGSGKTTIGRIIANEEQFPQCHVKWAGGTKLEPMVYNTDFIERNFDQSPELKGIFTLGEQNVEILRKISDTKTAIDKLTTRLETLNIELGGTNGNGGKRGELLKLENELKDRCWDLKKRHDTKLKGALEGFRNNGEKFKEKVLQERSSNTAAVISLPDLEKKAESAFGPTPTAEPVISYIDTSRLEAHENNTILKKRVIGKGDVDIAAMIRKLGNSDWVRQGRGFYDVNNGVCPFCQQDTVESFARSLNEYFDQAFLDDSRAIDDLVASYTADADRVQHQIANLIAAPSKFLDVERLRSEKAILDSRISLNNERLAEKKKEPSRIIELEKLENVVLAIRSLLDSANSQISDHNRLVANLGVERRALTAQVWKFLLEELKAHLADYDTKKRGLDKAIETLSEKITQTTQLRRQKGEELRELERQTTSIQPTIDAVNSILSSFGFQGFRLSKAASINSYKLLRPDGSDAKSTLSEGERTFVAFLYFYYLLKGSASDSGMTADRIVVFDDPVSSLDCDILFIVGTLIKALVEEVRSGTSRIKQVFVLTHNVYFHKDVTYNSNRKDIAMREETFWLVRRPELLSKLQKCPANPVKTSYELLWSEIRSTERSNVVVQNILRRILESYFKILGGVDFDHLCGMFDGRERSICKSLCSWLHDGSHNVHDDLYVTIDDSMVDAYLKVFRAIFEKSGHGAHYRMMMREPLAEQPEERAPS